MKIRSIFGGAAAKTKTNTIQYNQIFSNNYVLSVCAANPTESLDVGMFVALDNLDQF